LKNKTVCVVGLGYIGLPTAALLANNGYQVIGVDVDPKVVETINKGKIHIVEPDLDSFVQSAVFSGRLKAYNEPQEADIFILSVPTPFYNTGEIPQPNLEYVLAATEAIAPYVKTGNLVILESTSPVGTTAQVYETLKAVGVDVDSIFLAYCPERVLPGKIMVELIENDRIVGGINPASTQEVKTFYKTFVQGQVLETDNQTAEMSKLVENSYRDVNIAFANELSVLSDAYGINVYELIRLANHHPRVKILQPGCGVGGHCIAVDPWFLVANNPDLAKLIHTARKVNDFKADWVIEKVKSTVLTFELKQHKKPQIACMGLAFKPDIDDLRESPALAIAKTLQTQFENLLVVEPNIQEHANFTLIDYNEAVDQADILVLLVKHREFIDLELSGKQVLDFCGVRAAPIIG
jgi:UDP-N-acetyl-D-mannosaminuronic acid dehydrogenase